MKRWLRRMVVWLFEKEQEVVNTPYRQFACKHEFKVLEAANGGHVVILANYDFPMDEPSGKVYIVPEGEKIGDVITTMLVERKLMK